MLSNKPSESKEMAALKAFGILMWNMGSDIKRHEVQSSMIVLIAVAADLKNVLHLQLLTIGNTAWVAYIILFKCLNDL